MYTGIFRATHCSAHHLRFAVLALLSIASTLQAALELASPFTHHMVLQRHQAVPIWGTADAQASIDVFFDGQHLRDTADAQGRWRVELAPLEVGDARTLRVVAQSPDGSSDEIQLTDVLVGEVWLASGQSNMNGAMYFYDPATMASADHRRIRLFKVELSATPNVQDRVEGTWAYCDSQTVKWMSAVAYHFATRLEAELDVPVGIIQAAWSGSTVEAWIPERFLTNRRGEWLPMFRNIKEHWDTITAEYASGKAQAAYEEAMAEWEKAAKANGERPPRKPRDRRFEQHHYSNVYHGTIAPLVPYAIRGVIWYQGETNAYRGYQYRALFARLIQAWRSVWNQGDFPFHFVQLPNYDPLTRRDNDRTYLHPDAWASLREAQAMALTLPNTGMAVTIDIGESDGLHPRNKPEVGRRLARVALAKTYGRNLVYAGPRLQSVYFIDGKAYLSFGHIGSGLLAGTDPRQRDLELRGFVLAGADRVFHPASARIIEDHIVVSCEQVPEPVAVRYAWHNDPDCNLYNREGLPAAPFRSDDWPTLTYDTLTSTYE